MVVDEGSLSIDCTGDSFTISMILNSHVIWDNRAINWRSYGCRYAVRFAVRRDWVWFDGHKAVMSTSQKKSFCTFSSLSCVYFACLALRMLCFGIRVCFILAVSGWVEIWSDIVVTLTRLPIKVSRFYTVLRVWIGFDRRNCQLYCIEEHRLKLSTQFNSSSMLQSSTPTIHANIIRCVNIYIYRILFCRSL